MNNTGFITIGAPKITGSFILKIPGTTESLPMDFIWAFLDKAIAIASPIVAPDPPRYTNASRNPPAKILGICYPACNAAWFSARLLNIIGFITATTTFTP